MRAVGYWKRPTNGTQSRLQTTDLKDFLLGLQIRPRRFDSGLGLHPENPVDHRLRGFFMPAEKGRCVPHIW